MDKKPTNRINGHASIIVGGVPHVVSTLDAKNDLGFQGAGVVFITQAEWDRLVAAVSIDEYTLELIDIPTEEMDMSTLTRKIQEAIEDHGGQVPATIRITGDQYNYMRGGTSNSDEPLWRTYKGIHLEVVRDS